MVLNNLSCSLSCPRSTTANTTTTYVRRIVVTIFTSLILQQLLLLEFQQCSCLAFNTNVNSVNVNVNSAFSPIRSNSARLNALPLSLSSSLSSLSSNRNDPKKRFDTTLLNHKSSNNNNTNRNVNNINSHCNSIATNRSGTSTSSSTRNQATSTKLYSTNTSNTSNKTNMNQKTTISIIAILTATTLNLLGFTMTSPLTPTLGNHFSLPTGASFGSLTSAYPFGMLFGLFLWPKLSDLNHDPNTNANTNGTTSSSNMRGRIRNSKIVQRISGRKNVMAICLLGSTLGLSLQCASILNGLSLRVFLICRIITGLFSGCGPVAKAYLADVGDRAHAAEKKANTNTSGGDKKGSGSGSGSGTLAKYLAWRDAASTLAYILGPVFGGILFEILKHLGKAGSNVGSSAAAASSSITNSLGYVIGISALGSFIAALSIIFFVDDQVGSSSGSRGTKSSSGSSDSDNTNNDNNNDNKSKSKSNNNNMPTTTIENDYEIIACPLGMNLWTGVGTVCIISFLYHVADSTFFAFFPALLQNQLQYDAKQIGFVFTLLSCITFCFSATSVSSRLISNIGVVNTCALGLSAVGSGLCALSAAASISVLSASSAASSALVGVPFLIFGAAALYFCGVPLYGPTIPTMLLQCVPPYQRGTVMGIDGVINTIARIASPIIMGDIYRRFGASRTFGVAGIAVFSSSAIALIRRFIVLRDQKKLLASS